MDILREFLKMCCDAEMYYRFLPQMRLVLFVYFLKHM